MRHPFSALLCALLSIPAVSYAGNCIQPQSRDPHIPVTVYAPTYVSKGVQTTPPSTVTGGTQTKISVTTVQTHEAVTSAIRQIPELQYPVRTPK